MYLIAFFMAEATGTVSSLPYHDPEITAILVNSSFLLLLNVANAVLDRLVYCGLLGQILLGIAWGTPGAKWLSVQAEEMTVQLGYLGLILLVYEGGLSTSFKSLKANLLLSSAVALTGIVVPIGLSYTLQPLLNATPLQAFAAGAALCSTSLGTTFTVLASCGLSHSRLGVVLTSAAMMDDVVGLVMVGIISKLGSGHVSAVTVIRPILIAVAFAVIVPLLCKWIVVPATMRMNAHCKAHPNNRASRALGLRQTAFALHTALLFALVAGSTYAGTSNLFAAYIAGAVISWWDSEVPHVQKTDDDRAEQSPERKTSGTAVYKHYYHQAAIRILLPLFFASIGFSIPITRMFKASIVWRGIVYGVLMMFGKVVCGLWLVRFSMTPVSDALCRFLSKVRILSTTRSRGRGNTTTPPNRTQTRSTASNAGQSGDANPHTLPASKPFSLHPPLILGLAMTARGEIGFLISAVAESSNVFSSSSDATGESDMFLVVTWAIVLCTVMGPLGVGLMVQRVKKLQQGKNVQQEGAGRDVLGVWGVE